MQQEEVSASHILIANSSRDSKQRADALLTKLKSGGDFAEIAKANSLDKGSAERGGDLGFFSREKMVKPFSDAAFALKTPGDLSEVVESQFGYHIIKLNARKAAAIKPFLEVKDELRKEAIAKLQNDMRLAQEQRLLNGVSFEREAIEAFAAQNK